MKKMSIIVPCYNVEHLVGNCISSLLNQTMAEEDMELIFVDDASTDHTYEILCEWEKKYPERIMVIHCEENTNIGGARNTGMSYATGEYVGFVDSDDIVEHDMYACMYTLAKQQNADMVSCRTRVCTLDEYQTMRREGKTACRSAENDWMIRIENDEHRHIFLKGDTNPSVWNRIYRRNMLVEHEIHFQKNMFYEDSYFNALVRRYVHTVCGVESVFYNHILYEKSASHNDDIALKEDYIRSQIMAYDEIKKRGLFPGFEEYYDQKLVNEYITYVYACIKMFGSIPRDQGMRAVEMVNTRIDKSRTYHFENDKIDIEVQKKIFQTLG